MIKSTTYRGGDLFLGGPLLYFENVHLFGVGGARTDEGGTCDVGYVTDLGDGGYADAWVEAHFFKAGEGNGVEGDGISGSEEKAWGGGVVGVEIFPASKLEDQSVGNMEDGFGLEEGIAGEDFADGGVLVGIRFEEAARVVDAADGEGGTATVNAKIRITRHTPYINDFGFFGGDEFSEVGPVGDFVAAGGATGTGGGDSIDEGGLEFEVAVDEFAHAGAEVGGGGGIEAEAWDIGGGGGNDGADLNLI